ncbi:hypothetical protein AB0B94_30755 [Micromonospora sp. NPDC048986]
MFAALLLVAAVILAILHAVGVGGRVNLGWLAIACVIAAAFTIPALNALT